MNLYTIERPTRVAKLPWWPDKPGEVIQAAIHGAKGGPFPIAVSWAFGDGSAIMLEYQLTRRSGINPRVYESAGAPPLLCITVADNGAGVREEAGLHKRIAANDAERALSDLQKHWGKDRKLAMLGEVMTASARQYWVKVD